MLLVLKGALSMALVTLHEKDQVATLTLNDEARLNAMGEPMAEAFRDLVAQLYPRRHELRAVILTGAGKAFSAGGDLKMLERKQTLSGETNRLRMREFYDSFLSLRSLEVPVIAALNGAAVGAGLCVAAACDIRIAARGAKLGFTFTKLGLHPGMGASWFLPRVVGEARAAELMLTARVIDVDEALRIGLVSEVLEPERLMARAYEIAAEIRAGGPEAVRQLLETLRNGATSLDAALEREATCQAINYASSEFKEGVRAVSEKRPARFRS